MRSIFVFISALILTTVQAQLPEDRDNRDGDIFDSITTVNDDEGTIRINQSDRMKDLVLTHIEMNKRAGSTEGFRVQLFSGGGNDARDEALDVKSKILSDWEDEKVYVEYSAPFWRVRVGSFRHKHEALPLLNELKEEFPACYIVRVSEMSLDALRDD